MPRAAPTPCRVPMCPELVHSRKHVGYCDLHAEMRKAHTIKDPTARRSANARANAKRRADKEQAQLDRFYSSAIWRKTRAAHRAREPLCRMCAEAGRIKAGDVVDHIVERRDGGSDYDPTNLQTLCHACHGIKTRIEHERRGS